jgi:hypothetical protein
MSALSSFTTAVHTFRRLTSNCAIRAAGNRRHAQDDSIATVVILGLVWISYTAWPIYDLLVPESEASLASLPDSGCDRIKPTQTVNSRKITVCRAQRKPVFHSQCGQMGIWHEIAMHSWQREKFT